MYYIYIYLDPFKPGNYNYQDLTFNYEPFYVGRGKNYRCKVHIQKHKLKNKSLKNNKILEIKNNGLEPIIDIYLTGLTFNDSLNLEREFISKIGRQIKNEGPLTNLTTGGQGVEGIKMSNASKLKMKQTCIENGWYETLSKNMSGDLNSMSGDKWHRSEEGKLSFKNKMIGVSPLVNKTKQDKEIIFEKISKTLTNYEWSEVEKEKRRIGMLKVWKERKENKITSPIHSNIKIEIKITNITTKVENIFKTKKEAAKYLNITPAKFYRYTNNKIIGENKIEFIKQ